MATKRFVLFCQHFYPEMVSTGMHMTELATRLAELGWRVTVYCAKPSWGTDGESEPAPREIADGRVVVIRTRTIGGQRGSFLSRGAFAVSFVISAGWALLRSRDHSGLVITTNPPFLGVVGWLYSRLRRRPYMLIVYDVFPDIAIELGIVSGRSLPAKAWGWVTRCILAEAAVIVVIGRDMADVVRRRVPAHASDRIVLIPNWADERRVRPVARDTNSFRSERQAGDTFVVQYAGRFGRTHNVEPLIHAARILRDEDVLFQFIGDGPKKAALETLAAEQGVNNVEFLPYQQMERLAEMLSAADLAVVCLESAFTGLSVPSKAYGVMASGTPIMGFVDSESEIGLVIRETGCGVTLPDPGAEEIASTVRGLMEDPDRRKAMSEAGRSAFVESYTLARAARAYDAALSSMLNGARPRPRSTA